MVIDNNSPVKEKESPLPMQLSSMMTYADSLASKEQARQDKLKHWLTELFPKLNFFRQIRMPQESTLFIFEELKNDRSYGDMMMNQAEMWILKGDWTYKKQYILELADFYPTQEQMRQFKDNVVTVTLEEYRKRIAKAKQDGKNEQRWLHEQEQKQLAVQQPSETLLGYLESMKALMEQKSALVMKVERLNNVVLKQRIRIAELQGEKQAQDQALIDEVREVREQRVTGTEPKKAADVMREMLGVA